jgi:hypothetical protein
MLVYCHNGIAESTVEKYHLIHHTAREEDFLEPYHHDSIVQEMPHCMDFAPCYHV